jgi:hypothetical protein
MSGLTQVNNLRFRPLLTLTWNIAERIADQKFAVRALVTLYRHSSDIPGRTDTLAEPTTSRRLSANPKRIFKKFRDGVRLAATTTTTALGNVASEITGR